MKKPPSNVFLVLGCLLKHYLSKPDIPASVSQTQSDGRRFRYRTTVTEGSRQQNQRRQGEGSESDAWGQQALRRRGHLSAQRNRNVISQERRRYSQVITMIIIYNNNYYCYCYYYCYLFIIITKWTTPCEDNETNNPNERYLAIYKRNPGVDLGVTKNYSS